MHCKKVLGFAGALLCAGCPSDGDGDTDNGTESTMSTTMSTTMTAESSGGPTTADDASTGAHESTGHDHESTGHDHESTGADSTGHGSTGHDETAGTDHGTGDTEGTVCDVLGEGCHDNMTKEGIECHLIGHDGDVAACEEVFEMCAEICGL